MRLEDAPPRFETLKTSTRVSPCLREKIGPDMLCKSFAKGTVWRLNRLCREWYRATGAPLSIADTLEMARAE